MKERPIPPVRSILLHGYYTHRSWLLLLLLLLMGVLHFMKLALLVAAFACNLTDAEQFLLVCC